MKTLTVIAPVYNEAEVIETFYWGVKKAVVPLVEKYFCNFLFVVDRGTDGTLEILRRLASVDSTVKVLSLSSRFGHQNSLVAGLDHSDADVVIMMDSDLQHPPSLIPKMLAAYELGNDIVFTVRQDGSETSWLKRTTSKMFYRIINWLSSVPIQESASDFRLVSRRVVRVFQTNIRERNQFLRGIFSWVGFRSVGIPYHVQSRHGGTSKYSLVRMASFAVDGLVSFSKRPLIAAAMLGFALAGYGFLYAIVITVEYFLGDRSVSGWPTIVVFITVLSGTQLIFLGILGAYIGAIFDEVKGRPHYIVDEIIQSSSLKKAPTA